MTTRQPLPTLLSQVLVAFTIEFDNEFEHRMPHVTTDRNPGAGSRRGPWLVSQAMWSNFMQFLGDEGVHLSDIEGQARMTNLPGLVRWGYVVVEPDPRTDRPDPAGGHSWVRPTPAGRRAQEVWRPLAAEIETRWKERFGPGTVDDLGRALRTLLDQVEIELPPYLPVVSPTQNAKAHVPDLGGRVAPGVDLSSWLSQVLLVFTFDFESASKVSLPICANALRVLDETGRRIREFPALTGVSKEGLSMAFGFLERRACIVVEPDPSASRGKVARLTPKGERARANYLRILGDVEDGWEDRFGPEVIRHLRAALEKLFGPPADRLSPLLRGLVPYDDGWRASVRRPTELPHYPMVLHRGGFPDGS